MKTFHFPCPYGNEDCPKCMRKLIEKQPCDNFKMAEISVSGEGAQPHECPTCGGTRYFCANCNTDHHKGGWQSCVDEEMEIAGEMPKPKKNPHAQALRSIPSKKRIEASRNNGKKGGRPKSNFVVKG